MALIPCPDCGKMISDLSPACQFCGRPIAAAATTDAPKEKLEVSPALIVVAVLIVAGVGYALVDGMKGSEQAEVAATAEQTEGQPGKSAVRIIDPNDPMAGQPLVEIEDSSILPPGAPPLRVAPTPQYRGKSGMLEAIRAQIRQSVMAQEVHYNDTYSYAKRVEDFSFFNNMPGVRLTILNATSTGYGVRGTHDGYPGAECAFFIGSAPPVSPATKMGQLECREP